MYFYVIFLEKRPKLSLEHQTVDWDWQWDDGCQTEIVVNVNKNMVADDDEDYDKYYTAGDADGDQNPPQMAAPHDDDDSDVDSISDELVFSWEELPPVISANPRTAVVFQPGINK